MKLIHILLALLISFVSFGNDKITKTKKVNAEKVTIFLKGAQVSGTEKVSLQKGESIVKFTGLPSDIDTKSIRVKAFGDITILSVNPKKDFLNNSADVKNTDLQKKKKELEQNIIKKDIEIDVLNKQLEFLSKNQYIGGTLEGINLEKLKAANKYYTTQISGISFTKEKLRQKKNELQKLLNKTFKEINEAREEEQKPTYAVIVKVDVATAGSFNFDIDYFTKNAGWFPGYDLRIKTITKPMILNYRANVYQNTGIDWNNVKLILSTANPEVSDAIPEMKTYYLDFGLLPPRYNNSKIMRVSGRVYDSGNRRPIAGATVMIKNSTIGTITDSDGKYEISIPANANRLVFSFIGTETQERYISRDIINVGLVSNQMELDEVVVSFSRELMIEDAPVSKSAPMRIRGASSIISPVATNQVKQQTSMEFEIKKPFSIPADSKNHSVAIDAFEVPTDFKYIAFPKIKQKVFLKGFVEEWETMNLIDGEANIFFEGTFTGKTLLDLQSFSNTLEIPMGIDKSISVKRVARKQFSSKKFIGKNRETVRVWEISVRNNKSEPIILGLFEQIPVSKNDAIEVSDVKLDGGKLNKSTGKVTWKLKLQPGENIVKTVSYTVKHPKNMRLIVE